MAIRSINPFSNTVIKEYKEFSAKKVETVLAKASKTFINWRETSLEDKSRLMRNCAEILLSRKDELAVTMAEEMGKLKKEGIAEIEKCAACCEFYAENSAGFLEEEIIPLEQGEAKIVYQPLGVILAVMPWNFPFWQVFRFAAPNLMAGNVALIKHASNVSTCSLAIEKIFKDACFPDGTFQSVLLSPSKVNRLIDDERIVAVTLTGSEGAGAKVAERAGKNLKKTVLELGGSDPFIVLEDADLEIVVEWAKRSRMINCGQSCIAAKRFIVSYNIYDEFVQKLKEAFEMMKPGDPLDDSVDYGPLASEEMADGLMDQIKYSIRKGARLITGGKRVALDGAFVTPAILDNITPGMPAFDEELFGPVATIYKFETIEDAIKIANNCKYGLGGSVWTKNLKAAEELAKKIESGAVYINKMMASHPALPFGGIKKSGYGRELAHFGIREFTNVKTIWL